MLCFSGNAKLALWHVLGQGQLQGDLAGGGGEVAPGVESTCLCCDSMEPGFLEEWEPENRLPLQTLESFVLCLCRSHPVSTPSVFSTV